MKLNAKVFRNLTGEPTEVQEIDGKTVSFYEMDNTQYLYQFIRQRRFSVWTSDGKDYKVLVEKGYKEASGRFFDEDINAVWLNFFHKATLESNKMSKFVLIPSVVVIAALVLLSLFIQPLQKFQTYIILGAIVLMLIVNFFQSRHIRNKFNEFSDEAQRKIQSLLTESGVQAVVESQNKYMDEYFQKLYESSLSEEEKKAEEAAKALENEQDTLENAPEAPEDVQEDVVAEDESAHE